MSETLRCRSVQRTLRHQCRSVVGTDLAPVPKYLDAEVSWCRSVRTPPRQPAVLIASTHGGMVRLSRQSWPDRRSDFSNISNFTVRSRRSDFSNFRYSLGDTCRTVCAIALHRNTKSNTNKVYTLHGNSPPQWVVLQNSVRIEFAHTHLHTTCHSFRSPIWS